MTASRDIANQAPTGPRAGPSAGDGATPAAGEDATPPAGEDATPPAEKNELARRSVSGFEVFGQSLAATGPTISIGTLAVVYLIAGRGTIWSYILATVVAVLVGYSIAQFARRTAAAGSLYTYMASGLGRSTAFVGGWGLIFGYVLIAAACLAGAALYFGAFLVKLGLSGESRPWQLPLLAVFLVPTVAILIRGVRISTRVAVTLELISLVAIGVLLIALFVHYGARFDTGQFKATGSSATGIALGTVVAVSAFVGFEKLCLPRNRSAFPAPVDPAGHPLHRAGGRRALHCRRLRRGAGLRFGGLPGEQQRPVEPPLRHRRRGLARLLPRPGRDHLGGGLRGGLAERRRPRRLQPGPRRHPARPASAVLIRNSRHRTWPSTPWRRWSAPCPS